ncbi:MAG: trimethylamine methyltransferase family protein [Candidatus Omnitrophica bacterium]|nr:trimethylamine methyltransferase family protein [Candidatus Omnitrophota bacterium]
MELQKLSVLSESEIKMIHNASMEILSSTGVKILNKRVLSILKDKGLEISEEKLIVKFTKTSIEDSLSSVPRKFDVFDRNGKYAFTIGDGNPHIGAGHNAVFWKDSETGETRPSRTADVARFAHLCDYLEEIDIIGIPVMPQDVKVPSATLLYGVKATIENSRKPVYFSTDSPQVNQKCIELIKTVFQGDIKKRPYGICQFSPTSPLFWEGPVLDALYDSAVQRIPIVILPEPNTGISAPYTLAGLLTVHNVECLSGIAITQLLSPGVPVMYGSSWTTTDMRTGSALVGSVETSLCRIAGSQISNFYNIPHHTTAPNSDNHAYDEQNGWEKLLSLLCAVASGADLIINCGMFATGMTSSHEQLIMDNEMSSIVKRMARGILVNDETIAKETIVEIGPQGGQYLTSNHTLKWLRSDEHLHTQVSVREPFSLWKSKGLKDTEKMAKEVMYQIEKKPVNSIPAEIKEKLDSIVLLATEEN